MKTVWKFPIPIAQINDDGDERFTIEMPDRAEILTVQAQGNDAQIWAAVDTDRPKSARQFCLVGTGHVIPSLPPGVHAYQYEARFYDTRYVGTFQVSGGAYVFHVFEYVFEGGC